MTHPIDIAGHRAVPRDSNELSYAPLQYHSATAQNHGCRALRGPRKLPASGAPESSLVPAGRANNRRRRTAPESRQRPDPLAESDDSPSYVRCACDAESGPLQAVPRLSAAEARPTPSERTTDDWQAERPT